MEARHNTPGAGREALAGGEVLAAISTDMVQLLRDAVGKGPTRCKTHWAGSDMLIVVLRGGYLAAEQTLHAAGRAEDVRAARQALQDVLEGRMSAMVEEHVGRRVIAFMNAQHQEPDVQLEIFMLEPLAPESDASER